MDSRPGSWGAMASRVVQRIWSVRGGAPPPTLRLEDETGQGLAEYALILSLIAIVVIGALTLFGVNLNSVFFDPIAADIGDVLSGL